MTRASESKGAAECLGLKLDMTRRKFLFLSGAGVAAVSLAGLIPREVEGGVRAFLAAYPRQRIGSVSQLREGEPVEFSYPYDHFLSRNYLIKLGAEAGGGVGPDRDIVGFNTVCSHQGGPLAGRYNADSQVLGPCPLHLTTFDLTRHGMVVSGHATQGLPQITLETEGDDIYATGVLGLFYGLNDNQVAPV